MFSLAANSALWSLVDGAPSIDPDELLKAIEQELAQLPLDFRTRLLIRDSYRALEHHWGQNKLESLSSELCAKLNPILNENLGAPGFPSLERRVMETTKPDTILQFLRELGANITAPARLDIGGSSSLILSGYLSRATENVDIVDEVPQSIRVQHELLAQLTARFGLAVTHFQSHYLPSLWQSRIRSLGMFGNLEIRLIDVYDIFVGKLFSNRDKDRDDLRMLMRSLNKPQIIERLKAAGSSLAAEPPLHQQLQKNWYILFGDQSPI